MKSFFVYKCKLSLSILYSADMFINELKTNLNVFFFLKEWFQNTYWTNVSARANENKNAFKSFIYRQENVKAGRSFALGHERENVWRLLKLGHISG